MKVYLAGPMRGYPEHNYQSFNDAAYRLRQLGHEVFCPTEVDASYGDREALALELAALCSEAEMVVVLPGWETSLGTAAEVAAARALSIPVATFSSIVEAARAGV